jgi:pantetheine-phosphate adenylyltransferase
VVGRKYRIGIYPGSFNPFHVGHLNIVQKTERVFDKVVIARGINPEKGSPEFPMPSLPNEMVEYKGLVTELFDPIFSNIELFFVRGLRGVYDIGYEENLRKIVHDINKSEKRVPIEFVYFFCDSGLEHVSSSQIRGLMQFDKAIANKYLVK